MTLPIDRDAILAAFQDDPTRPLKAKDVGQFLEIAADKRSALRAMLRALVEEGDLVAFAGRRFALPHGDDLISGRVQLTQKGYGWFIRDDGQPDAFLPPGEVNGLIHGDTVRARVSPAPKGPVASITKMVARGRTVVTGVLTKRGTAAWVECPANVMSSTITVEPGDPLMPTLPNDTVVEVMLTHFPTPVTRATGRIMRALGRAGELSVEVETIISDSSAPRQFSPETLAEAESLPPVPSEQDHKGREDLRELPLCTIDGETAKDFDDAVYGRRDGDDLVVIVAIADVSHYVTLGSALDDDARERGTSIYYPGRVIPMLPEALSNGLCSLNPNVERLCLAVELRMKRGSGKVRKARFFNGLMRSHARLTYTDVARYIDGDKEMRAKIPDGVQNSLAVLQEASRGLRKARSQRGAMDFDLPEEVVELNEDGEPADVKSLERNEAHRLIEDLMIAANEAVADGFDRRGLPSIYRVHQPPNEEKVERFLELARALAADLGQKPRPDGGGGVPSASTIREILQPLAESPLRRALDYLLLRAMMQARYSAENIGHYSLASEAYTHFTSPIRRYPDLAVHRLMKAHIKSPRHRPDEAAAERQSTALEDLAVDCSEKERRATDLERAVRALFTAWLVRDRVGDVFTGSISGCASFGVFVRVENPFVEGMIRAQSMGDGRFDYDELRMRLHARSGFNIGVGDEVEVELTGVDLGRRQVTFRLLSITSQHGENVEIEPASGPALPGLERLRRERAQSDRKDGDRKGGERGRGSRDGGKGSKKRRSTKAGKGRSGSKKQGKEPTSKSDDDEGGKKGRKGRRGRHR